MHKSKTETHTAIIVDETTFLSLSEICEACDISPELINELIAHGIIEPINEINDEYQFTAISLHRSQQALRLHQDLGINLPGVALALDLLDELRELRTKFDLLEKTT